MVKRAIMKLANFEGHRNRVELFPTAKGTWPDKALARLAQAGVVAARANGGGPPVYDLVQLPPAFTNGAVGDQWIRDHLFADADDEPDRMRITPYPAGTVYRSGTRWYARITLGTNQRANGVLTHATDHESALRRARFIGAVVQRMRVRGAPLSQMAALVKTLASMSDSDLRILGPRTLHGVEPPPPRSNGSSIERSEPEHDEPPPELPPEPEEAAPVEDEPPPPSEPEPSEPEPIGEAAIVTLADANAATLKLLMGLYDHIEWIEKRAQETHDFARKTHDLVSELLREWKGAPHGTA